MHPPNDLSRDVRFDSTTQSDVSGCFRKLTVWFCEALRDAHKALYSILPAHEFTATALSYLLFRPIKLAKLKPIVPPTAPAAAVRPTSVHDATDQ